MAIDIDQLRQIVRRGAGGQRLCSLPYCGNTHRGRGMCMTHYRQWERTGSVAPIDPVLSRRPKRGKTPKPKPAPKPKPLAWLDVERLVRTNPQPGWQRLAACNGKPDTWFFPTRGESATDAKKTCRTCPVRYACLAEALTASGHSNDHGIRGGTSVRERRTIRTELAKIRRSAS